VDDGEAKDFYLRLKAMLRERGFGDLIEGVDAADPVAPDGFREAARCLVYRLRRLVEDLRRVETGTLATFADAKEILFSRDPVTSGLPDLAMVVDISRLSRGDGQSRIQERNRASRQLREIEENELG